MRRQSIDVGDRFSDPGREPVAGAVTAALGAIDPEVASCFARLAATELDVAVIRV